MGLIKRVVGWVARRGVVFVALLGALFIYQTFKPSFQTFRHLRELAAQLAAGEPELLHSATAAWGDSERDTATFYKFGLREIDDRIATETRARAPLADTCRNDIGALVRHGVEGVIANRQACLRLTLLTREIDSLQALRSTLGARNPGETLLQAYRRHAAALHRSAAAYRAEQAQLEPLLHDYVPNIFQRSRIEALRGRLAAIAADGDRERRNADRLSEAHRVEVQAALAARSAIAQMLRQYHELVEVHASALSRNLLNQLEAWAKANKLGTLAKRAAIALLLIIVTPYLIRLACYFVLAPIAMRRPAIRLQDAGGRGAPIPPAGRSAASVSVRLDAGEELVVRQDHIQTTSHVGGKRTQWFMNCRRPITSVATGLTFLTRIRGDGELTSVSAVRDGFAEVAVLALPTGSACVLHPRALVAWAKPIDRPLDVRTRWRLGSINAWLTLQLRYVVFHGPVRLVIKGGRGVRIERAEQGRVFGQDQLIGFSADLAYAVERTETFWPYFLGREQLLKDRVAAGEGVLIIEEAPLAGRKTGEVRHGIEGLIDAVLKVFGL